LNLCDDGIDQEPLRAQLTMSDPSYRVDLESICRTFPLDLDAPSLLIDFAHWLDGRPWGSVGCFDLVGNFSDHAFWDGSSVRNNFALFMRLPTGSLAGAWYPSGHKPADAPIVLLDSEGQWKILGASLEAFLARLALREIAEESDLAPDDDDEQDATDELAAWLRKRLGAAELEKLTRIPDGLPDFRSFMENWYRERAAYWAYHPTMTALAKRLARTGRREKIHGNERSSRLRSSVDNMSFAFSVATASRFRKRPRLNRCCAACATRCGGRSLRSGLGSRRRLG
jgi:hypothetical protein